MTLRRPALLLVLLVGLVAVLPAQQGAYWPQFRGPDRSNVARDVDLLKEWPKDGPPLVWQVTNLGGGYAPVSVAEGRVYTLAHREGKEYALALDRGTGKEIWAAPLGAAREESVMQFLFQRQPVVDSERLYVFSRQAQLVCLDVDNGQVLWQKDYPKDFQAQSGSFGWNDNPLIDGDRLICTPGGKGGTITALNKRTGEVIWQSIIAEGDRPAYSPVQVAEICGVRQYVQLLSKGLVGVAAKDGKFLWRYDRISSGTANVAAPIVRGDHIFVTAGFGVGSALIKVAAVEGNFKAEEVYVTKNFQNLNGGIVALGDHIYGGHGGSGTSYLTCVEWKSGQVVWQAKERQCVCGTLPAARSCAASAGRRTSSTDPSCRRTASSWLRRSSATCARAKAGAPMRSPCASGTLRPARK